MTESHAVAQLAPSQHVCVGLREQPEMDAATRTAFLALCRVPDTHFSEIAPSLLFRLRLRADPSQWRWLLAFLSNSRAGPHRAGKLRNLALARYSLACLHQTRAELGNDFSYDDRQKGILQLIPAAAQTHAMQRDVDEMAARDMDTQTRQRCVQSVRRGRIERQEALDDENRTNIR